jgi:hypothetical protein
MADKPGEEPKIIVDSDWKEEAKREKERLSHELDEKGGGAAGGEGPLPEPTLAELINMILMQTMIAIGGMQTPDGRVIPQDLEVAKHNIDLLALLGEKTKGNLTDDEQKLLDAALYELRMRFVQATSAPPPSSAAPTPPKS